MKIKDGYLLREIAGNNIIIPVGEQWTHFNGIMTLNDSGAFLWKKLEEGMCSEDELVSALLSEYEVDEATAKTDVSFFISSALRKGLLK